MKQLVSAPIVGAIAILLSSSAAVHGYPEKPVRVIVPVPAGGTPDIVARLVATGLSTALKQQFVVDNRSGAGSRIGTELAVQANPDGYTLLISSGGPLTILPHVQRQIAYDPLKDLAPIGLISSGAFVFITHPSAPFKDISEFVTAAKRAPGTFNYASAGNGSPNHLATELLKLMAGIDVVHVPYKGAPQGVADVLANQITVNFSSIAPVLNNIRAGKLRALATSGATRSKQLADVPTVAESVASGYVFTSWFGMLAPAKTPAHVTALLNKTLVDVIRSPETQARFESLGAEAIGSSPAAFREHIRREFESNGQIAKRANIRID